jgi:hypothetical protein
MSEQVVASLGIGQQLCKVSTALILRDCNEGILVFDEVKGKTFLLNTQAGQVLRALISMHDMTDSTLRTFLGTDAYYNGTEFQELISVLEDSELVGS